MSVLSGGHVELPEVSTELEAGVLFLQHDDRRGPGTVGGTDNATR